jgi:hypothetical protein
MSRRLSDRLLADFRVVWAMTLVFVLVGVAAVVSARTLHDEGLLTWYFAGIVVDEPIPGLFWQKLRPPLALFYAPFAGASLRMFGVVHVLVSAAAIPMIAAVARELGQRWFVIPAFVLASSPLLIITAAAGHSNADALVGLVAALYLLIVKRRALAAGILLGALVLVRAEIAAIVLVLAAGRLFERDLRFALGMPVVPLAYALLGALYHHDLLWIVHYPPTLMAPAPDTHWLEVGRRFEQVRGTGIALLCLSPALGLIVLLRPRALGTFERTLAVALALFLIAIRGLPTLGLFNFDSSPRYLLVCLPLVALVIGRQADDAREGRDGGWLALGLLTGVFVVAALGSEPGDWGLLVIAVIATTMALVRFGRPGWAIATWMAALLISMPLWPARTKLLPPMATLAAIEQHWRSPGPDCRHPIVTNIGITKAWLHHRGILSDEEVQCVHFMVQHDMAFELDRLFDHDVGQGDAVMAAMQTRFYGRPIIDARDPEDWPAGTLVVFADDRRLQDTVDLDRWRARLEVVQDDEGLLIGVIRE